MSIELKPLFKTTPISVPVRTTNPVHPMFGKNVDLDYDYSYVELHSAFCSTISIIGEESIHTIHIGSGHGIFLSITEQRADNDSTEVLRIPFTSSLNRTEDLINEIITQIALVLVHPKVYEVNKAVIDERIRKILPY